MIRFVAGRMHIAALLAGLLLGAGCATRGGSKDRPPPEARAVEACRKRLNRGVERALQSADDQGPFVLPIRFNPPRCDAPNFEVRAHGYWVRAYLDGNRSIRRKLDSFRESTTEAPGFPRLRVEGDFSGKRRADSGLRYPVFWIRAVEPDESPEE